MSALPTFDAVWHRITTHAGHTFHTKTSILFSYGIKHNQVQLNNTNRIIPRQDFAKAHALMPLRGPGVISKLVQGSAYVYGVLMDERIMG